MSAPDSLPWALKWILTKEKVDLGKMKKVNETHLMNFPNLEELSFLTVLALPKASRTGLALRILFSVLVRSL